MSNIPNYKASPTTSKGILQKPHDYEAHITPEHKLKWDENKLKATEKQKSQVLMKVDEPNTPYIRYDPTTDQVTNWQDIPESVRKSAMEEPEEFSLDNNDDHKNYNDNKVVSDNIKDEWEKAEEKEQRLKEEQDRKRHQEFEKKRAKHYYHNGDVLHDVN